MKRIALFIAGMALTFLFLVSTARPIQASENHFNRDKFDKPLAINNPYYPLVPGTTYYYEGTTGNNPSSEELVVTDQTREILGVQARVVHDTNWENGKLVEDTYDWYAQDNAGNVWYLGEDTAQYKNGKVIGHEGAWLAGKDGAEAGIIMEAKPEGGDTYRQEFLAGVAEDTASVLSLSESVCVPDGCFSSVIETKEFSPLEPGVVEHKYYAAGVGEIKSVVVKGEFEVNRLVRVVTP